MNRYVPIVIMLCALVALLFSVFGDSGYSRLRGLRQTLEVQRDANTQLNQEVRALKHEVQALGSDKRELEKAARNELGMARPDDMIFIFEDRK